ncbi:MAG: hypothetical protein V4641_20600 [Pseudomonadota bacterium]
MMSYAVLLGLAIVLNLDERRSLALALVVGAGIFAPIPDTHFYLICGLIEMLVGALALLINARASITVWRLSALLAVFHTLGYFLDGYPPESPYHLLVQIAEHAELVACIFLSTTFTWRKRYDA